MDRGPGLHRKIFDSRRSSLELYQEMFIGKKDLMGLLKYEIITTFLGSVPGAVGLMLRKTFYRGLLRAVGNNVIFGKNITLRHPHKINVGNNVIIDDDCVLDAKGENNLGIFIGDRVTIGRNSTLICKNGDIRIGSNVNITPSVQLVVAPGGKIKIGDNVEIGSFSHFSAGTYSMEKNDILPSAQGRVSRGIILKDSVMIGAGVIILDGVTIGKSSIIGAGSVVTESIPERSVAFGIPARVMKERGGKRGDTVRDR